jgi:hypothetical protein
MLAFRKGAQGERSSPLHRKNNRRRLKAAIPFKKQLAVSSFALESQPQLHFHTIYHELSR